LLYEECTYAVYTGTASCATTRRKTKEEEGFAVTRILGGILLEYVAERHFEAGAGAKAV